MKKQPSLERKTQWRKDRNDYATVVLAGAVIERRVDKKLMGDRYRSVRQWFVTRMPAHIKNYVNGPFSSRRAAVAYAKDHLEGM